MNNFSNIIGIFIFKGKNGHFNIMFSIFEPDILNLQDGLPKSLSKSLSSTDTALSSTDTALSNTDTINLAESYGDKTIKSYLLNGNTYKLETWIDMLTSLCDYFAATNNKDFEKVLWISNEQKPRFSRYGDQLRMPEKVKHTDIFVETKLTPDEVVRTCGKLLAEFGYSRNDLKIEAV